MMELTAQHLSELRQAKILLERPSLVARITDAIGTPIEIGFGMLPEKWAQSVHQAVHFSLTRALQMSIRSLDARPAEGVRRGLHNLAVVATGATGGAFGLAGVAVELPISTTIMLRSIAAIGRSEGEDLSIPESRLSCLEVFALGGRSAADDASETGYFAVRSALAKSVTEAARHIAQKGMIDAGAPALVRFITAVGSRFGIVVTEKTAAMAIPAIGAAGGAIVNSIFINHFQDVATGHFVVRRLERAYGKEVVERAYRQIDVSMSSRATKRAARRKPAAEAIVRKP